MTSDTRKEVELQSTIEKALKKIKGTKENELCRYLPMDSGGYMHHFTFRKMKGECPKDLIALIRSLAEATQPETAAFLINLSVLYPKPQVFALVRKSMPFFDEYYASEIKQKLAIH